MQPPAAIVEGLARMGLARGDIPGEALTGEALTGGVSSDIWRIDLQTGPLVGKRALAKLRVAADWQGAWSAGCGRAAGGLLRLQCGARPPARLLQAAEPVPLLWILTSKQG